ncbi:MAG: hypothetical protein R3255_08105 [Candidatus Lokiarchaeia archaeon]|nr:hypothetical protein [Candidatus Lokiarchaeia archaeon]
MMDINNLIKIIAAVFTFILAVVVGLRVYTLNPRESLNRWFTIFFTSTSIGFLLYTIYHLILNNSSVIIPLMITTQIFFNFIPITLVMTVFILEKYTKGAMSFKYLGTLIIILIIMSFGYFVWPPELNLSIYNTLGIVDTTTPLYWFIFVNSIRACLIIYVVYKYAMITKNIEDRIKKKVQLFFIGIIFVIIAVIINLIGGIIDFVIIEVIALVTIDIGSIVILRGFLLKSN